MTRFFTLFLLLGISVSLSAQSWAVKRSVMLSATVQEDPPSITLHWPDDDPNATGYQLYRRTPFSTDPWGPALATLPAGTTTFTDTNVTPGNYYEYRIVKSAPGYAGYGYLFSGIRRFELEAYQYCILVVDDTHAGALEAEIDQLIADLQGDRWIVKRIDVSPDDPVTAVKDQILALYNEQPNVPHAVFLLGHVPVPYSGNINPDGHPDHQGAWPADGYYGDVDGVWTDLSVNNTVATGTRNDNVPGDGKFDQSLFPSPLELPVGRVDFANLPALGLSETELLRRYLQKNHAFRHGEIDVVYRGLIEDNFGSFEEGFSQNGLRNFSAFFGADSVFSLDYRSTLQNESYLWSYGCGAGSYTSCSGITNTGNYAVDSLRTVFTMLFGSYFGDWDSPNNLLRAALASGQTLVNVWAGRPNWHLHLMGMGFPINHSIKFSQNNSGNAYTSGYGNGFVHTAVMGDPTLHMYIVKPVSNVDVSEDNGKAIITWEPSPDATDGYFIYRKVEGPVTAFARVHNFPVEGTTFIDSTCLEAGKTYTYMVKARKLMTTASGTFFELSQGIIDSVAITTDLTVQAAFEAAVTDDQVALSNNSLNATGYFWDFGDGNTSTEAEPVHTYQTVGDYEVTLIASGFCPGDTVSQTVSILVAATGEAGMDQGWKVFPNPAANWLQIGLDGFAGTLRYRIFDLQGKLATEGAVASGQAIDLASLPSGAYLLEVTAGERTWAGMIQKE
jgi:PKD repeat protein